MKLDLYSDYQIQTKYCGHGEGEVEEFVQAALHKGLGRIAFTEHFPVSPAFLEKYPHPLYSTCFVPQNQWDQYCEDVLKAQETHRGRIEILLGAEVDYLPEFHKEMMKRLDQEKHRLSILLGSVHFIDGICIDLSEDLSREFIRKAGSEEKAFPIYYQHMEAMIESGFFQQIAHFDLLKKFGCKTVYDWAMIDRLLDLIQKKQLTIQINTAGWDKPCQEAYPSEEIVHRARRLNIPLVLASDAHHPREVGRFFDRYQGL